MLSLAPYHTFALPSSCESFITVCNEQQLTEIDWQQNYYILGEGSNTVFIDDFYGQVIKVALKGIKVEETAEHYILTVAAGENWHELVKYCLEHGINGLENLALIPGTVGAAPVQNIGAYGVEVKSFITKVRGWNIQTQCFESLAAEQCRFGYRESVFKQQLKDSFVITEVSFSLPKQWLPNLSYGPLQHLKNPSALEVFDAVIAIRNSKLPDPVIIPNAGSFFKNPVIKTEYADALSRQFPSMPRYFVNTTHTKLAAGWLIEQAGLKGKKVGDVMVSEKQALVLINEGKATGKQLKEMVSLVKASVAKQFSINLEHEVRLVSETGEVTIGDN